VRRAIRRRARHPSGLDRGEREYALLKDHPDLDTVVPVDTRLWRRLIRRRRRARGVGQGGPAARPLRAAGFDVALRPARLIKSGLLTAYTGAPLRIGFTADHCARVSTACSLNRRVRPPAEAVHVVDQYLALLGPLGIPPGPVEFTCRSRARRR